MPYKQLGSDFMPPALWQKIRSIPILDMHIHPSFQLSFWDRNLLHPQVIVPRWLLAPRSSLPQLQDGNVRVILSAVLAPEREMIDDFRLIKLLYTLRIKNVFRRSAFQVVNDMLCNLETFTQSERKRFGPDTGAFVVAKEYNTIHAHLHQTDDALRQAISPEADTPQRRKQDVLLVHAIEGGNAIFDESDWNALNPPVSDNSKYPIAESRALIQQITDLCIKRLIHFKQLGVAYITLAHFYPNVIVPPTYPFPDEFGRLARLSKYIFDPHEPARWRYLSQGLTEVGRNVVQAMIDLKILIDMSHCTPQARSDILELVEASGKHLPVLMTHVGAFSINPSPYNPTAAEIKRIEATKGVVGCIFMNYWTMLSKKGQGLDTIVETIKRIRDESSIDTVGIGTDFDGFTETPDDLDEPRDLIRLVDRLLAEKSFSEDDVRKITSGNMLRALSACGALDKDYRESVSEDEQNPCRQTE